MVLERRARAHVLARIRAGVLEQGPVEVLRAGGVGARMDREGLLHDGCYLAAANGRCGSTSSACCGKQVMIYGQTEVTHDLYDAQDAIGAAIIDEAEEVAPHDLATDRPFVTYSRGGTLHRVDCDFVAGCDGFHGSAGRRSRRRSAGSWSACTLRLAGGPVATPPAADELIYANHARALRWPRCGARCSRATTSRCR